MSDTGLPQGFEDLERWVGDWSKATRVERYAMRLSKTFEELAEFYDAVASRAEEAIAYLDGLELKSLPDDAMRLLRMLYSFVLISYAVNIFQQPKIPDAGAAFFDMVVEPAI